jgi:hypothetical protein
MEIIAVCSRIHTKHINTLCWQNVELLNVKLVVHRVTTGLEGLTLRTASTYNAQYEATAAIRYDTTLSFRGIS